MKWNAKRVREELPPINCKIGCQMLAGRISGYALEHALVTVQVPCACGRKSCVIFVERQFSWESIATAMNKEYPILNLN